MTNIEVTGKRVVIAGGSRGIGRSIALAFAAAGAQVSICARGAESLDAARADLAAVGGVVHAAICDLANQASIARYIPQAAALATKGIRVNCVAPGSIDFPDGFRDRRKTDEPALYGSVLASMPAKRLGRPEEVANVVLFLASPLAICVTAQIIGVNGGQGFAR